MVARTGRAKVTAIWRESAKILTRMTKESVENGDVRFCEVTYIRPFLMTPLLARARTG